jgi:hypothetical protein
MIYYNGKSFESQNSFYNFLLACSISPLKAFSRISYVSEEDSERCIDLACLVEMGRLGLFSK